MYQSSSHIHEIGPDGTGDDQITFGADVQHYAAYSPDGTMIVFCRGPGTRGPWALFIMRVDDGAEVRITHTGSCTYPDWHKD